MNQWDRFSSAVRQLHDSFDHPDVEIYNYSDGYDPSTGKIDWGDPTLAATISAEVVERTSTPEASEVVGPEGQEENLDATVFLRDDEAPTIHEMGDDDTKPTEIVDPRTDKTYAVVDAFPEDNGLIRLTCVES